MEQLPFLSEFNKFSIAEKILILEELWDSIATKIDTFELTGEQRDELDWRFADYSSPVDRKVL